MIGRNGKEYILVALSKWLEKPKNNVHIISI